MIQDSLSLKLPEGLIWSDLYESFFFVDIKRQSLFKYKKDTIELIHIFNESIGFAYPHYKKPDILICGMKSGIYSFDINKKNLDVVIDINRDGYRINDGYIDHNNIIWFGTMCDDDSKISNSTKGCFYSYTDKNGLVSEDRDYFIPNGPIVSNDRKWIFHSDSMRGIIYKYEYKKQYLDKNKKKIFFDANKYSKKNPSPDGMIIDKTGNLLVSMWGIGEVWLIGPDATLINSYKIPGKNVTNICYGGKNHDRLLVTYAEDNDNAGGIFEIDYKTSNRKIIGKT